MASRNQSPSSETKGEKRKKEGAVAAEQFTLGAGGWKASHSPSLKVNTAIHWGGRRQLPACLLAPPVTCLLMKIRGIRERKKTTVPPHACLERESFGPCVHDLVLVLLSVTVTLYRLQRKPAQQLVRAALTAWVREWRRWGPLGPRRE